MMLVLVKAHLRSLRINKRPMTFGRHLHRALSDIVACTFGCNILATFRYVGDSKLHPYFEIYIAYWGLPFHELGERPFFSVRRNFFDNDKPKVIRATVLSCIDEVCQRIDSYLNSDCHD